MKIQPKTVGKIIVGYILGSIVGVVLFLLSKVINIFFAIGCILGIVFLAFMLTCGMILIVSNDWREAWPW